MAVGFPAKTNFATGEVLTATAMNDITGTLNLLQSTLYPAGRNKVINADFGIWQRGTSFSTDGYTADRFAMRLSGATATTTRQSFTVGQTDVPNNPTYFARLAVTTGDNNCRIETILEDVTLSSGQTFTLSFWAKGTNPAGGSMEIFSRQEFGSGGSTAVATSQGTITLTASWQRFTKTFTYASVSGKTIGANNAYGFDIRQPSADTGAAAWTLDISNVQLENGSTASPFQTASGSIQGELALCQRYYYRWTTANGGSTVAYAAPVFAFSATQAFGLLSFPVSMRVSPTSLETTGTGSNYRVLVGGAVTNCNAIPTLDQANPYSSLILFPVASGLTTGQGGVAGANSSSNTYLGFVAEL